MKPYYDRGGITLFCADARDVLPGLDAVDCILTDPPYSPRAMKNARSGSTIKQRRDGQIYDFGYAALTPELRTATAQMMARLVRRWAIVWADLETAHLWHEELESSGLRYVRTGVWVREHGAPQFSGDRPAQGAEAAVILHGAHGRLRWNGGGRPASWVGPIVNAADAARIHTSPKPLWLMRRLVLDFSDPGEVILDPFAGSCSALRAAKDLGRKAIGIEINEAFCEAAARRLEQEVLPFEAVS